MKKLAGNRETIAVVEVILDVVGVDLAVVRLEVDTRQVQVAIGATPDANLQDIIHATALRILSGLNLIWGL